MCPTNQNMLIANCIMWNKCLVLHLSGASSQVQAHETRTRF